MVSFSKKAKLLLYLD